MQFPTQFVWGVATASFQIEGASEADGKGPSVWDAFCRRPGAVYEGHTGDLACDHYDRSAQDVGLLKELGVHAYRFSVSWPRVMPNGEGPVNKAGLDFYDRLVDLLLDKEIEPYLTLFHWDYPLALYHRGGWMSPDSPQWFGEYAAVLAERLGDRVTHWMTQNEPQCFLGLGHVTGVHAPGLKVDWPDFLRMLRHSLLGHGLAVQALRAKAAKQAQVSFAPVAMAAIPASDNAADVAAARSVGDVLDAPTHWHRAIYLDPVLLGTWPEGADQAFGVEGPTLSPDDLRTIHQPLDWLGLNFYSALVVRAGQDGRPEVVPYPAGYAQTDMGWPVTPEGLYWAVRFHYEKYGLPILITENGMANLDWVGADDRVRDPQRIDFTRAYLRALHRAIEDGVDVRGYFHWSFLDNFEWAEGYRKRFGLVHVDYATQKRTIKDSGMWYRDVVDSNGATLFAT